jgi:radical SAM protein with 4Fe4S-binding SPASM domain
MIKSISERISKTRKFGCSKIEVIVSNKIRRKLQMLPKVPPTVYVELTNECNLNCVMCDRGSLSRKKMRMDMRLFKKVIDNAAEIAVPEVKLNRFGEPLLQELLIDMIKYAKGKGISRVYFATNATLLSEAMAHKLILSGLDSITFSVDGGKPHTYERIRRGASYEKVVENIETFARIRKQFGRRKPEMVLNTILMKDTEDEMPLVFEKWSPIVDKINVIPVGRYGNVKDFSGIDRDSLKVEKRVCHQPFDRLLVFWDGSVTVCCADINGELCVGNVLKERLEQTWRNRKITEIRRMLIEKNYNGIPICASCDLTNMAVYHKMQRSRKNIYSLHERGKT